MSLEYINELDFNKYIARQMSKSKGYSTKAIIKAYLRNIFLLHEEDKISMIEYLNKTDEVRTYIIELNKHL